MGMVLLVTVAVARSSADLLQGETAGAMSGCPTHAGRGNPGSAAAG